MTFQIDKDDDFYRRVLERSRAEIMDELDAQSTLDLLLERGLLEETEHSDIYGMITRRQKAREILNKIAARGSKGINIFKTILKNSGHQFLAEYLDHQEAELEKILMVKEGFYDERKLAGMRLFSVQSTQASTETEYVPESDSEKRNLRRTSVTGALKYNERRPDLSWKKFPQSQIQKHGRIEKAKSDKSIQTQFFKNVQISEMKENQRFDSGETYSEEEKSLESYHCQKRPGLPAGIRTESSTTNITHATAYGSNFAVGGVRGDDAKNDQDAFKIKDNYETAASQIHNVKKESANKSSQSLAELNYMEAAKMGFGEITVFKKCVPDFHKTNKLVIDKCIEDETELKLLSQKREKLFARLMNFGISPFYCLLWDPDMREYYFPTPYMEKRSLIHTIEKGDVESAGGPMLKDFDRLRIMHQIASAIDFLHIPTRPAIRRKMLLLFDIQSKNVVIDRSFNTRIIDFHLAQEIKCDHTKASNLRYFTNDVIGYDILTLGHLLESVPYRCCLDEVMREFLSGRKPSVEIWFELFSNGRIAYKFRSLLKRIITHRRRDPDDCKSSIEEDKNKHVNSTNRAGEEILKGDFFISEMDEKQNIKQTERNDICLTYNAENKHQTTEEKTKGRHMWQKNVPFSKETFQAKCKQFGKHSKEVDELTKDICQDIKAGSGDILKVWPAYRENNENEIVFVVVTKTHSKDIHYKHDFEIVLRQESETNDECLEVLMREEELDSYIDGPQNKAMQQIIEEYGEKLQKEHNNLIMISPSSVKSSGFSNGMHKHNVVRTDCIALFVQIKGLIPYHEKCFPKKLGRFPVDVRENIFRLYRNKYPDEFHKHLKIGCEIGPYGKEGSGTLGGFIEHEKYGLCFVTCYHIFRDASVTCNQPGFKKGDEKDSKRCGEFIFGLKEYSSSEERADIDVALVKIDVSRLPRNGEFPEITSEQLSICDFTRDNLPIYSSGKIYDIDETKVHQRDRFIKYGATTLLTVGRFETYGSNLSYGLKNQIIISDKKGYPEFSKEGDSGSLVFCVSSEGIVAVGLLVGGGKGFTVVTPICDVLHALQFTPPYTLKRFSTVNSNEIRTHTVKDIFDENMIHLICRRPSRAIHIINHHCAITILLQGQNDEQPVTLNCLITTKDIRYGLLHVYKKTGSEKYIVYERIFNIKSLQTQMSGLNLELKMKLYGPMSVTAALVLATYTELTVEEINSMTFVYKVLRIRPCKAGISMDRNTLNEWTDMLKVVFSANNNRGRILTSFNDDMIDHNGEMTKKVIRNTISKNGLISSLTTETQS